MSEYSDRDTSAGICGTYSGIDFNLDNVRRVKVKKSKNATNTNTENLKKENIEAEPELGSEFKEVDVSDTDDSAGSIDTEISDKIDDDEEESDSEDIATSIEDNDTEETSDNVSTLSDSAKPMIHNVTDGNEFKSMAEAERYYGLSSGSVSVAIKSGTEVNGMKFEKY